MAIIKNGYAAEYKNVFYTYFIVSMHHMNEENHPVKEWFFEALSCQISKSFYALLKEMDQLVVTQ